MAMINLTKKYVDILVNGGQEASYEQYDTNGDYDVSVSDVQQYQYNVERDVDFSIAGEDQQIDLTTIPETGYYWITAYFTSSEQQGDNFRIRRNGSNILNVQDFGNPSKFINLDSGDQISYYCYDGGGNGAKFIAERVTNEIIFTDREGNDHRIPTGFTVNGVTQTTSN
jgi:hypothetical protein